MYNISASIIKATLAKIASYVYEKERLLPQTAAMIDTLMKEALKIQRSYLFVGHLSQVTVRDGAGSRI